MPTPEMAFFKMASRWYCMVVCFVPVWILIEADNSNSGDRCNKTIDIYQAVSSPIVTDKNRGKPLHCSYRVRIRPARDDWVVFVRFTRMKVGEPTDNRTTCKGGYVQIVDGYRDSNETNRESPGFYCGEIDSPKTFISETPHVKIVFHVENYDFDSYLQFDANVEQQREVHSRYGQYAQLYPNRRGIPVPGTYCEREFHDCSPGRCFVQSPGFPGIYPRNLKCRYHLRVSQSLVGLDLTTFDVDGLRCDNLLMCFPRPISRYPGDCPYDYVRVYDGPTIESPLISTLCGRGRLKSSIIGSGSEMLVEFISSSAGPLLNTGFHFKADTIYGATESEPLQLRHCNVERRLTDNQQAIFSNIRSWYPANTTCTYRFLAPEGLRLEFMWFRVERTTLCKESLKLYDASYLDPAKILSKLCDINRPRTEPPRRVYETTGPALFVEFTSQIGSMDGSSISYGFEVKAVSLASQGSSPTQISCSKNFIPEFEMSDTFSVSLGEFNLSQHFKPLFCNYSFDASSIPHGRVNLTLYSIFQKMTTNCGECFDEYAKIEIFTGNKDSLVCLCKMGGETTHVVSSLGSDLMLSIQLDPPDTNFNLKGKQFVDIKYMFYSEPRCGVERMELDIQGVIMFPTTNRGCIGPDCSLYCRWTVPVFHRMDIAFRLSSANCTTDQITVNQVALCRDRWLLLAHESDIHVELFTSDASYTNFTLWWTQLRVLPTPSTSDILVSLGKECEFLCASSRACLPRELVCNGIPNCPGSDWDDEDPSLCNPPTERIYWWMVGGGISIFFILVLCLTASICRKCRSDRERF